MTLRLGCIVFAPQFCRCLVAVPMCCGYTYHLYRVESDCDISFWCKSLSRRRSIGFLILWCPNVYQSVSRCEDQRRSYTWYRLRRIMPRENGKRYFVAGMDFTQGAGDFPTRMSPTYRVAELLSRRCGLSGVSRRTCTYWENTTANNGVDELLTGNPPALDLQD